MSSTEKSAATGSNGGENSESSRPDTRDSLTFNSSISKELVKSVVPADSEQSMHAGTGDCFLLQDLPSKCTVGLDTIALTVDGKTFKGFRDIPPGPHFLWISESGAISRCGYWFVTEDHGKVRVKQWDRRNETLSDASMSIVSERTTGIEQIRPHLVPHSYKGDSKRVPERSPSPDPDFTSDSQGIWHTLTSAITPSFLARVTGRDNVSEWLIDTTDGAKDSLSSHESNQRTGRYLDFLFHHDLIHNHSLLDMAPGAVEGSDTTSLILSLLNLDPNTGSQKPPAQPSTITADTLLAEFQFTFLTGLHLGNHTCIEQWWDLLLKIILPAQRLISLRPKMVASVLTVFYTQMVYNDKYIDHAVDPATSTDAAHSGSKAQCPSASMLDTIPRDKARLKRALTTYRAHIQRVGGEGDAAEHGKVVEVFRDLEGWFLSYGWDLSGDQPTDKHASLEDSRKWPRTLTALTKPEEEKPNAYFGPSTGIPFYPLITG
ncbi:hypothetical protein DL546_000274 [Coniochaeta pulveracea]|uniref:Uncharacterized protein n=1 Tax=Coniochaeta pulveracea TaxID=177199 RepID=A0A420XXP0_9PEZI|nr:hypothetical protein DL546_000274 [Coniochaeta pulveracea]